MASSTSTGGLALWFLTWQRKQLDQERADRASDRERFDRILERLEAERKEREERDLASQEKMVAVITECTLGFSAATKVIERFERAR